ncbi:Alpha/Beta hydrolase protein [Irpex lacteus]|nr:Alpha/Beta hydrolase protein [Irpex lacteus]
MGHLLRIVPTNPGQSGSTEGPEHLACWILLENGPLLVTENGSLRANNASWANLVDYVFVDQPVGTGFSTAESDGGYIFDEDQMGADFLNSCTISSRYSPVCLPSSASYRRVIRRNIYSIYLESPLFHPEPPVNLSKIAIGNGAIGSVYEIEILPALSLIETYPQLISYDAEVYQYFKTQPSQQTEVPGLDDFGPYNVYNLVDARAPPLAVDPTPFLNVHNRTRAALHAPTSKNWTLQINYPFNSSRSQVNGSNPFGDPSIEPAAFLDELATNATEHGVKVIIYVGNDDSVAPHLSSEITIQNTTFGGIQGFTRKPATPWYDDAGNFAGVVHQERNWTYILVDKAGHEVPEYQPQSAFVMYREFILGNNQTGLLTNTSTTAVGGENPSLLLGRTTSSPARSLL